MKDLYYSFIIPVYNRPKEIEDLLNSFINISFSKKYEIVIIEDGSTIPSKDLINKYKDKLTITYFFKANSGPGDSRNYGMKKARGNYFLILDSDCILPSHYLKAVDDYLNQNFVDCFGGPDTADESFTKLQKAINYVMTSFLTTGGIRGNKKALNKFEPRSFNMGLSKKAFQRTKGFGNIHPGEDPDLSQRVLKAGFETQFIPQAFVYHKRRISWSKFYIQVKKFGTARPILNSWHPKSAKITFWFPSLFVAFVLFSILALILGLKWPLYILLSYCALIFIDASVKNKSLIIGITSIRAMFVQFFGYGIAFVKSFYYIRILNQDPKKRFPKMFFNE